MKITARSSGGFAGRSEHLALDTGCRPDGMAIEALLARLDFFGAASVTDAVDAVGADLQRWEITVDDGARCRTVLLAEDGGPNFSSWQALLTHLRTPP